jgi:hypothetical protein
MVNHVWKAHRTYKKDARYAAKARLMEQEARLKALQPEYQVVPIKSQALTRVGTLPAYRDKRWPAQMLQGGRPDSKRRRH